MLSGLISLVFTSFIAVISQIALTTHGLTVAALLAVQAEEVQWFDFTAVVALTSFCRRGFKGHGGFITPTTLSNSIAGKPLSLGIRWCCCLQKEPAPFAGGWSASVCRGVAYGCLGVDGSTLLGSPWGMLHSGQSTLRLECM